VQAVGNIREADERVPIIACDPGTEITTATRSVVARPGWWFREGLNTGRFIGYKGVGRRLRAHPDRRSKLVVRCKERRKRVKCARLLEPAPDEEDPTIERVADSNVGRVGDVDVRWVRLCRG
jgi:hypothetical protein